MTIIVTRPKPQGESLCQYLYSQGYDTIFLPVIDIKPVSDNSLLVKQIACLDQYDWAIFVSRSAVAMSQALIHQRWLQFPPHLKVLAVGEGSAQMLQEAQLPLHGYPSEWSSEGLLVLAELQVLSGKKIAIFCGQGGRELLAKTLRARGAQVDCLVSYQRHLPQIDLSPCISLLQNHQIDAIICTSVESVLNFKKLFTTLLWEKIKKIPLVLVSERIMIQARFLGFENCFLSKNAKHESIADALRSIV